MAEKMLPESYPDHYWRRPVIGVEMNSWDYDGDWIPDGFNSGPAKWCRSSLMGITCDINQRRHIQRIEQFTKAGLTIGIASLLLGAISLMVQFLCRSLS